jgi:hypothetical protein
MRPEMLPGTSTPKPLQRGPNAVLWGTPDGAGNSGSWSYVEPSSQSMTFLAADIAATKQDLRELGRQPLTAQSGNLTTITTAVAAGKAKSALAALVEKLKDCLMQSFYITSLWEKNKIGEMAINIFDDFDDYNENGKDLETLASARREREISHKTYIQELKNRKVLDQSVTSEDELKELLLEIPSNDGEN